MIKKWYKVTKIQTTEEVVCVQADDKDDAIDEMEIYLEGGHATVIADDPEYIVEEVEPEDEEFGDDEKEKISRYN